MDVPRITIQKVKCPGKFPDGRDCGTLVPVLVSKFSTTYCFVCMCGKFEFDDRGIRPYRIVRSKD